MKYFFLIAILSFSFLKTSAQEQKVPVGSQPAEIIRMGDDLHVFCSGADVNGNGIVEKDSGDVEASWWIFDAATMNVKRSKVLEGGFLKEAPLNIGMNKYSTFLFHEGIIKRFLTESQVQMDTIQLPDSLKTVVAVHSDPYPNESIKMFELFIYSKMTNSYLESHIFFPFINDSQQLTIDPYEYFPENEMPIQAERFAAGKVILSNGISGQSNSKVTLVHDGAWSFSKIVGEMANFMIEDTVFPHNIFVTMYGDHVIHLVHATEGNILQTIPTQTTGFKGPRECAIDGDNLYVTTYNCDIRKFSISTGELLKIIPVSGMADPIQIVNGKLIVGITRTCDSLPNNSISVIDITTSVDEEEPFAITASVSPNPFKNSASITASFPPQIHSATLEIFTSSGNSIGIFTKEVMNGELHFPLESDVLKLAQGQYMARISAGKQMSVVPFVVVR